MMPGDAPPGVPLTDAEKRTNAETMRHILTVRSLMQACMVELGACALRHDWTKLRSPEVEAFTEHTPKLAGLTYGSDEYRACLAAMKPAIDHHNANNSHHPEFYRWHCPVCESWFCEKEWEDAPQGPNDSGDRYCPKCCRIGMLYESQLMFKPGGSLLGMDLFDLIEMLCDWKAATLRHADGDLDRSLEVNAKRFSIPEPLFRILANTIPTIQRMAEESDLAASYPRSREAL